MPGPAPSGMRLRLVSQFSSWWVAPTPSVVTSRLCPEPAGSGRWPETVTRCDRPRRRPGRAGAQLVGQALVGVVTHDRHRMQAVAAAGPSGVFHAGVHVDEVRVDAQHDRLTQIAGWARPTLRTPRRESSWTSHYRRSVVRQIPDEFPAASVRRISQDHLIWQLQDQQIAFGRVTSGPRASGRSAGEISGTVRSGRSGV
jgi:hypothetical protein